MAIRKVNKCSDIDPKHRALIIAEAVRLNGSARSMKGFDKLRRFARKKCRIIIDNLVLRRLLQGKDAHQKGICLPKDQGEDARQRGIRLSKDRRTTIRPPTRKRGHRA